MDNYDYYDYYKYMIKCQILENRVRIIENKLEREKRKKHIYKVELGRCVRKLTRIYEKQMQLAVLAYTLGRLSEKPHEYVDRWKQM